MILEIRDSLKDLRILLSLPLWFVIDTAYATSEPEPTLWEWYLRLWPVTFPLVAILGLIIYWKIGRK